MPTPEVRIALIAAVAANGTIGRDGGMPWHIPQDFRYFKTTTMGWPMVMGRRTWESLPGQLPGRAHIVLSTHALSLPDGVQHAHDLPQGLEIARANALQGWRERGGSGQPIVFIIGGAHTYAQALPLASDLYLTEIAAPFAGDTIFPPWERDDFTLVSRQPNIAPPDSAHPGLRFDFAHYVRR